MAVQVKAYFSTNEGEPEIRRFSVDEGAATSFLWLQKKIQNLFPAIKGKGIEMYWRDEDKESVMISSDEELMLGLGSKPSGIFHVLVKTAGEDAQGQAGMAAEGEHCTVYPDAWCVSEGCKDKDVYKKRELMNMLPGRPYCHGRHGHHGTGFGHHHRGCGPWERTPCRGIKQGMVGPSGGMFGGRGGMFGRHRGMFGGCGGMCS